jgi:hypothetical protein
VESHTNVAESATFRMGHPGGNLKSNKWNSGGGLRLGWRPYGLGDREISVPSGEFM